MRYFPFHARTATGIGDAFATLAGTCEAAVFRIALRITGNMADAEDVRPANFLLKAFAHFDQFATGSVVPRGSRRLRPGKSISLLRRQRDSRWTSLR